MISSGTIAIPRFVESLRSLYVGNFSCDTLNGKLANFVVENSNGDIVANFQKDGIPGTPHGVRGSIRLFDGEAREVFAVPDALMQFELGAPSGPWTVIDNFSAVGLGPSGVVAFRSMGADPADERSLIVEFGVSDLGGVLKALDELRVWAQSGAS